MDLSRLIGSSISSSDLNCPTARTITVTARAGEQTAATNIFVEAEEGETTSEEIAFNCTPNPVIAGNSITCSTSNQLNVNWSFNSSLLSSCNTSTPTQSVICPIPSSYPNLPAVMQVTASRDGYVSSSKQFQITTGTSPQIEISCTPSSVAAGSPISCSASNQLNVNWSFNSSLLSSCNTSTPTQSVVCPIPSNYPNLPAVAQVTATKEGYTASAKQFQITAGVVTQLDISCAPLNVVQGETITCTEKNGVNIDSWTFGGTLSACNLANSSTAPCNIPYNQSSGTITVTATKIGYNSDTTSFIVTDKTLADLVITCDSEKLTGKAFTCSATC